MHENINIRFATAKDSSELSKVIVKVITNIPYYNDLAKKNEISKFLPDELISKISSDDLSVIVATINEEIVGFCLSRFDDYLIWLEWFGVLDTYRGKGLSHLLLRKLEETISVRNCHKIWCDCRTENKASVHILSSNGFKQIATVQNHWYKQDFILWEKSMEN